MKNFIFALCLIASTTAWALEAPVSSSDTLEDKVSTQEPFFQKISFERIVDGDTFVGSGKKIRLWGVNAPEKKDPNYLAATWYLESLLKEGNLTCKFIEKDRYQRDVMHCLNGQSDVGSLLVQMGLAKDYARYSGGYYQTEQAEAQAEQRGI